MILLDDVVSNMGAGSKAPATSDTEERLSDDDTCQSQSGDSVSSDSDVMLLDSDVLLFNVATGTSANTTTPPHATDHTLPHHPSHGDAVNASQQSSLRTLVRKTHQRTKPPDKPKSKQRKRMPMIGGVKNESTEDTANDNVSLWVRCVPGYPRPALSSSPLSLACSCTLLHTKIGFASDIRVVFCYILFFLGNSRGFVWAGCRFRSRDKTQSLVLTALLWYVL